MKTIKYAAIVLIAVGLAGCRNSRNSACGDHAHSEMLQRTAYNQDVELFIEAKPFVTGEKNIVIVWATALEDFTPLTEGKMTISLIVGKEGIRQTLEMPSAPGQYIFSLSPGTSGIGKLVFDIHTKNGESSLEFPDIMVYPDSHTAYHAVAGENTWPEDGIVFTKEQSRKVDFATSPVMEKEFGPVIRAAARILPSQEGERVISAKTAGIVNLGASTITEGMTVSAGQTLFGIESGGLAGNDLNLRYAEASNEYNRAKAEYERKKELAKDQIVSRSDLQVAEKEFLDAEVVFNTLKKNFSSGRQILNAPFNGYVKQILVRNGEFVEEGQPVVVISTNNTLYIQADLQSRYYPLLNRISSAVFRIPNGNPSSLEELDGKVVSFGKSTDGYNHLLPVVFQVRNTADLIPGSFIEAYIKIRSDRKVIAVPNSALTEEMGNYFVFVQITPELFEKRPVTIGQNDGMQTEIVSGLISGERIVSRGAIFVKLAQASGALDPHAGHMH